MAQGGVFAEDVCLVEAKFPAEMPIVKRGDIEMSINLNNFREALLANKSPEAVRYLESLWDVYTAYMPISYALAEKSAEKILQGEKEFIDNMNDVMDRQFANGSSMACYTPAISDFQKNICTFEGVEMPTEIMLKKSIYEFIHWASICFDLITQLINAALLGRDSIDIESLQIIPKVTQKIQRKCGCCGLFAIMESIRYNQEYLYIRAFDNCVKHIQLVESRVPAVQINIGFEEPPARFTIKAFSHKRASYNEVDALDKIRKIYEYVRKTIYKILLEIQNIILRSIGGIV